jgi:heme/copper-type cytochrome/quinol oxidase subunit 4
VRPSLSRLIKLSPAIWAVSVAVAAQLFAPEIWWHPDCNLAEPFNQSAAAGLPLPYVQRSVATSDIFYMPHIMLLNLIIVAGVALPLTIFLFRRLRARRAQVIQAVASVILLSLLLVLVIGTILVLEPTRSLASSNESYFDYRPVIGGFRTTGGSRCVR